MPRGSVSDARVVSPPSVVRTFFIAPLPSVQYTHVEFESTAINLGEFRSYASSVTVPPFILTFLTAPPLDSVQYTLVESTVILKGLLKPDARIVGVGATGVPLTSLDSLPSDRKSTRL